MTLKDILNADHHTLIGWARDGLAWWIDTLAEMAPRRGGGAKPVLESQDGAWLVDGAPAVAPSRGPVSLALPSEAVLQREITLPLVAIRDARSMVALDLDRLTPFSPDQVYVDLAVIDRDRTANRHRLRLAVVKRAVADAALAEAAAAGWRVSRLSAAPQDGWPAPDFLPAIIAAGPGGGPDRGRRLWWTVAAGLVVLNLLVLVGRDILDTRRAQQRLDAQKPMAEAALALRSRVQREQQDRAALLARRSGHEPLRILAAATDALPPPVWLQRLEWTGRTVRLAGFRPEGFDVQAAVRGSPAFTGPRQLALPPAATGRMQRFDVVADVEGARP